MDATEFYEKCKTKGLDWAKKTLREWVDNGQPEDFCSGYTSRAMCRIASNAITGHGPNSPDYLASNYGVDIYLYIWRCHE